MIILLVYVIYMSIVQMGVTGVGFQYGTRWSLRDLGHINNYLMIIIYVTKWPSKQWTWLIILDVEIPIKWQWKNLSETDRKQSQVLININLIHSGNQTKAY